MFFSTEPNITHEHYTQVVMTSVEPSTFGLVEMGYNRVDLYEYTHHSHAIKVGAPIQRSSRTGPSQAAPSPLRPPPSPPARPASRPPSPDES